jgi:hypothetical protein
VNSNNFYTSDQGPEENPPGSLWRVVPAGEVPAGAETATVVNADQAPAEAGTGDAAAEGAVGAADAAPAEAGAEGGPAPEGASGAETGGEQPAPQ